MKACLDDKLKAAGVKIRKTWSRQRKWQILKLLSGKCTKCGKPAVLGTYCDKHNADNRANAKMNYYAKKARVGYGQSASRGIPKKYLKKVVDAAPG